MGFFFLSSSIRIVWNCHIPFCVSKIYTNLFVKSIELTGKSRTQIKLLLLLLVCFLSWFGLNILYSWQIMIKDWAGVLSPLQDTQRHTHTYTHILKLIYLHLSTELFHEDSSSFCSCWMTGTFRNWCCMNVFTTITWVVWACTISWFVIPTTHLEILTKFRSKIFCIYSKNCFVRIFPNSSE